MSQDYMFVKLIYRSQLTLSCQRKDTLTFEHHRFLFHYNYVEKIIQKQHTSKQIKFYMLKKFIVIYIKFIDKLINFVIQ